jgi:hypothetical protein
MSTRDMTSSTGDMTAAPAVQSGITDASAPKRGVRWTLWDAAFVLLLLVAFAWLLFVLRHITFWWDEWDFIDGREGWSLDDFLRPHNGHLIASFLVVYKPLLATVGMHTYVPYMAIALGLHVLAAAGVYVIARRRAGPIVAFGAGAVLVFLGTGWQGFFLGVMIANLATIAAGLWALYVLLDDAKPRRRWPVVVLLLVAISAQGTGLPFLAAAIVAAVVSPHRRALVPAVVPATVAYLVWYLAYNRSTVGPSVLAPDNLLATPAAAWEGIVLSIASVSGFSMEIATILAVLLGVAMVLHLIGKGPIDRLFLSATTGLVTTWALIGLTRQAQGIDEPRYVYLGAVFVLLITVSLFGRLRGTPSHIRYGVAALGLAGVALTSNVLALDNGVDAAYSWHDRGRATVDLLLRYGGSAGVPNEKGPDDQYYPPNVPGPTRLRELVSRYGSPLNDAISGRREIPMWALDTMLVQIVKPRIVETIPATLPPTLSPLVVVEQSDIALAPSAGCQRATPSGEQPRMTVEVPRGQRLYVRVDDAQDIKLTLSRFGAFHELSSRTVALPQDDQWSLALPDLGDDAPWLVRLEPPGPGAVVVCTG